MINVNTKVNTPIFARDEWIEQAAIELARIYNEPVPNSNLSSWAAALAETYYDEFPGDYTPKEAVEEDLSYA